MVKKLLLWSLALGLLGACAAAAWATLHPHYTPAYAAFFIRHEVSDYETEHYDQAVEEGITFSRPGLPSWVKSVHGLSVREPDGRWTNAEFGNVAGLDLNQVFEGDVCVEFNALAARPLLGRTVVINFGDQRQVFRVETEDSHWYRFDFVHLHGAERLDLVLPTDIPAVIEVKPSATDIRRVGLKLMTLRLLRGRCPAQ